MKLETKLCIFLSVLLVAMLCSVSSIVVVWFSFYAGAGLLLAAVALIFIANFFYPGE